MAIKRSSLAPKQTRNAEATRARILETAQIEFVTNGLNGARVDRIAEQAGVNKNLIYHYFGSKDDLYLEVLEGIYTGLRARQQDDDLRSKSPAEAMAQLVGNTFDHFVATPELVRLMSIENIHYAQHLKRSTSVKPLYRGLLRTLEDLLRRGQADGSFRRSVDPVDLYMSISGLAYFFLSNQYTLSWLFDRDFQAHQRVAKRRQHVVDMVLSFLTQKLPNKTGSLPSADLKRKKSG
ncbi:MAG: TetR/AcrR family transcriptional regulator, partial [Gammaproteobacteria bacterium]